MVVIIDDRADVWEWSPNLVKVIPCKLTAHEYDGTLSDTSSEDDFFVGIGDINSAFLPKLQPLVPVIPPPPAPTTADPSGPEPTGLLPDADDDDDDEDSDLEEEDLLESTDNSPSNTQEDEVASLQQDEMLNQNTLALEAQFEERPLAKKQEELQHETADEAAKDGEEPSPETAAPQNGDAAHAPEHRKEKPVRKALLKNDDSELVRVKKVRRAPVWFYISRPTVIARSWISFMSGSMPLSTPASPKTSRRPRRRNTGSIPKHPWSTTFGYVQNDQS